MEDDLPLTGAVLSLLPTYQRKPALETIDNLAPDEPRQFWDKLSTDFRKCALRTAVHRCTKSCFKHVQERQGKRKRKLDICRHKMQHFVTFKKENGVVYRRLRSGRLPVPTPRIATGDEGEEDRRGRVEPKLTHPYFGRTTKRAW